MWNHIAFQSQARCFIFQDWLSDISVRASLRVATLWFHQHSSGLPCFMSDLCLSLKLSSLHLFFLTAAREASLCARFFPRKRLSASFTEPWPLSVARGHADLHPEPGLPGVSPQAHSSPAEEHWHGAVVVFFRVCPLCCPTCPLTAPPPGSHSCVYSPSHPVPGGSCFASSLKFPHLLLFLNWSIVSYNVSISGTLCCTPRLLLNTLSNGSSAVLLRSSCFFHV